MVLFSGVTTAPPAESAAATASRGREGGGAGDVRRTKSPDYSLTFSPTPPPLPPPPPPPPPPPRPAFNQHVNKRKVIFFLKRSGGDKGSRGVVNPLDTLMEEFVPVMLGPLIMQGCISVGPPPLAATTAHRFISPSSSFALGFPALFHFSISKKLSPITSAYPVLRKIPFKALCVSPRVLLLFCFFRRVKKKQKLAHL